MDQKKNLLLARIEFKNIVHSLIDKKKQIFAQSANLEKIMDEFRNVLNPEQVGKFLVWLETVRYLVSNLIEKQKQPQRIRLMGHQENTRKQDQGAK
jgi:hypothetical protein